MKKIVLFLLLVLPIMVFGQDSLKNTVEFNQRYENFIGRDTYRTFTSLAYGRKVAGKHDLYGRLIYQNRDGEGALQSIVDFYPTYNKGYMFFSFRYSNSILFPQITGIGEVYRTVGKKFEASLGARYIRPLEDYNIYVLTGTFGMYHGNWFTYVRPMLNFLEDGTGWSGMIVTRRYFGAEKNYIEATYLRGKDAGTTRPVGSVVNSFGLDTYLFRLKGNVVLPKNFTASLGVDYSGIYIPKANDGTTELNILGVDITIKKKF